MIDIHSHFLPNIDDGARNCDESIAMLTDSKMQGVDICAGTSHIVIHDEEDIESYLKKRSECIGLLEQKINETNSKVPKLIYGAEIFLDNDISQYGNVSKLCIGDSNCLLVELSTVGSSPFYSDWLYSLTLKGISPIIAHIERYPYIHNLFGELAGVSNIVYQINAETLLKRSGRIQLMSVYNMNKTVVIGSDMHNMTHRKCYMKEAFLKLERTDSYVAKDVFVEFPRQLLGIKEI